MAEAFLKQMAGDRFEVESAGLEPGKLNPAVVEVMKEVGIDISQNKTKSVFDFYKAVARNFIGALKIHLVFKVHGKNESLKRARLGIRLKNE
jgi:hypothetical protein